MRFILKLSLFSLLCCSLTSCGSVINGRRQEVTISSNPTGATVSDGINTYTTPAKISLLRNSSHLLTVSKPGYEPQTIRLERTVSGAVFANILFGGFGLIGWGVDALSGGQWKLLPETADVTLRPSVGPVAATQTVVAQ